jgi:hypothetical protein
VPAFLAAQDDTLPGQVGRCGGEDRRPQDGPAVNSAAVEGIAQPGKEAVLAWRELARRRFLAAQLGQLAHQLFLLRLGLARVSTVT